MNQLMTEHVLGLRRHLDQDGYVVVRDVVSKDRLDAFNAKLTQAYATSGKFKGGGTISGHLNCFPGEDARFIYEEIEAAGIGDFVRSIREDQPNHVRPTLNFNLPGSRAQHYHMDGAFLTEFLICNVAVVDTNLVNGAIDLLPSTQLEFYPFWRYALERKYRLTTRVPMSQGDVLLRKSTLWHRGMPNKTDSPRPMMSLTFGEESAPTADPFAAHDGRIVFYPNWYNSSGRLGILRERVEVRAPFTRSTVRFAKSLVGKRGYAGY